MDSTVGAEAGLADAGASEQNPPDDEPDAAEGAPDGAPPRDAASDAAISEDGSVSRDGGPADAAEPVPHKAEIRIEALIDGRSQLVLRRDTAQWRHLQYAAPGLHESREQPTLIGGVEWKPAWPNPGENRDCRCSSDLLVGLRPSVPAIAQTVVLRVLEGRSSVAIAEQPSEENDYGVVVEFNDNARSGSAVYRVELEFSTFD